MERIFYKRDEMYGGNRNMPVPHPHFDGEPINAVPGGFTGKWSEAEKKSEAAPETEEDKKLNYWTPRYSRVSFGPGEKHDG